MSDLILLAMDGSAPAQMAAKAAIQIAARSNLLVLGLYVVDEGFISDPQSDVRAELGVDDLPGSKAELVSHFVMQGNRVLGWLENGCHRSDVLASTDVRFGGITETLLKEADQAMLIGIGRRGHGHRADPSHLGLNFQSVALHTQKPLLVGGDELRPIKRVLAAFRGGSQSKATLDWAARLQRMLDVELTILAVGEKDPATKTELDRGLIERSGLEHVHILQKSGHPAEEIVSAASEVDADLVIMGRYGDMNPMEWLTGSVPDHVLRMTPLPILIV